MEKKNVATLAVVGTFQVKLALSQQREFVLTGHVYSDDTKEEINARVDAYQDVADRQLIRGDITSKEAQIEQLKAHIMQYRDQLEHLTTKQEAAKVGGKNPAGQKVKLSSQELQILSNGWEGVKGLEKQIESLTAAIAAARAKLAKV